MSNAWRSPAFVSALFLMSLAAPARAVTRGMVADSATNSVTVFDADTGAVFGSVVIPASGFVGDCSITADQTRGFVTDFENRVWVIDLTTTPPSLAPGPNPIFISNPGEDTSISPDKKFLAVCDGVGSSTSVSVVDIATQTEIATFDLGTDCNSVDVCSDGSVLVTSFQTGNVRRLTIGPTGALTDTGEVLSSGGSPNNVLCAPGGHSGVVITRELPHVRSFAIPGLTLVNDRPLSGDFGISGQINPAGNRIFARSNFGLADGFVDVFDYNSVTGVFGATPLFSIPIATTPTFFGMDQIALHSNGTRLYVSQPGAVNVYDAGTGAPLPPITDPHILQPTGVIIGAQAGRQLTALSDAHLWIGLKNNDDQGTQFDVRVEAVKNGGAAVASGLKRCITGLTRNPTLAKEVLVSWNGFAAVPVASGDVLSLRVSTRIGTNPDGTKCAGPGGSHNSAVGLRLYYDSTSRLSRFDATIAPASSENLYLRAIGTPCPNGDGQSTTSSLFLSDTAPAPAAQTKCKDSGGININVGNPFSTIGTWDLAPLP